jgi:hypothetical protein
MTIYPMLIILSLCIPGAIGTTVISNGVTTAAGSISYSIEYSGTGIIQNAPVDKIVANDNSISASVTGCSIDGASQIKGALKAATPGVAFVGNDNANVSAIIDGPGASVTNYNLYGYVTPDLAWAGQYVGYARGTNINLQAIGDPAVGFCNWAGSLLLTHPATSPVYTVSNWYQDAMAGGAVTGGAPFVTGGNAWAMADIYSGMATVQSSDPNDWVDVYTGGEVRRVSYLGTETLWGTGANEWVSQNNFIK